MPIFFSEEGESPYQKFGAEEEYNFATPTREGGPFEFPEMECESAVPTPLRGGIGEGLVAEERPWYEAEKPGEEPWYKLLLPAEMDAQETQRPAPFVFPALQEYPAYTPPLECPPPFLFPAPPPMDDAPVAAVTGLLQEVLGIMNTVMSEQGRVEEESEILGELVELVAIMQQEAEALVEYVDLVEEYVEEVDTTAELEEWVQDLESIRSPSPWPVTPMTPFTPNIHHEREMYHEREDSGISMGSGSDVGSFSEPYYNPRLSNEVQEEDLHRELAIHDPTLRYVQHQTVQVPLRNPVIKVVAVPKVVASRRGQGKGKKKRVEPQFRDSALGLMSPAGLTPTTPSRRGGPPPRWI